MTSYPAKSHAQQTQLLPNFCALETLFPLVVIGELLAFVLVLKPGAQTVGVLQDLALTSLFIQWVVLTSSGVLCVLRRHVATMSPTTTALMALGVIVVTVAVLSEAAYWTIVSGRVAGPVLHSPDVGESALWLAQQEVVDLSLEAAWHTDFLLRNVAIGAIVGAVALRYSVVHFQWRQRIESESQARIAALQARIRPHFLFNSMNTIASFTRTRPELAEQVVEDLADLFRAGLADASQHATFANERELAAQYLRIEALRLGPRLSVNWACDAIPGDARMPALLLQPLVENAVYHGIEPLAEGGDVMIAGEFNAQSEAISLVIRNTMATGGSGKTGNQMAQDNVRQRLLAFFAERSTFEVKLSGTQYEVRLAFPYLVEAA
tara:strand:- start:813 stop:1949 length:1137 start_codon:yes stop_codon:yes gene_type:complete